MSHIVILVPAAGASSRMRGADKLLEPVAGRPLLARQVDVALASGAEVLVTLPAGNGARRAVLPEAAALQLREIPDAREGMAASLRAGAAWAKARSAGGLMVFLADLPEITSADLQEVMAVFARTPDRVVRAVDDRGRPGHPAILPARLFDRVARLRGDRGARDLLAQEDVRRVALPGDRATIDLDTPEAWAAWRRRGSH